MNNDHETGMTSNLDRIRSWNDRLHELQAEANSIAQGLQNLKVPLSALENAAGTRTQVGDSELSAMQEAFSRFVTEIAAVVSMVRALQNELSSRTEEVDNLGLRLQEVESENHRLQCSLDERFKELGILTAMLAQREDAGRQSEGVLESGSTAVRDAPWRIRGLQLLRDLFGGRDALRRARDRKLIQDSGLFDGQWYLRRYPDVAASGIDPVEHFLRYGTSEKRDPGPGFDTEWYLETYPDVADSGMNPLVHYLTYGRAEQRHATQWDQT